MNRKITYIIQSKLYRVREYKDGKERTVGCFKDLKDAKLCAAGHHWLEGMTPDPSKYFGFIYEVSDALTGMKYIGKKQYWFYTGDCETSNDRRKEDWNQECWEESDWKYYTTSSKILSPIILERPNDFTFKILSQEYSKLDLHLQEIYFQQHYDVLNAVMENGERAYFNQNIGSCEFNIHDSGEAVRAVRYNPIYQAWAKMMKSREDIAEEWKDHKKFIKDNQRSAKGMKRPKVVRVSSTGPLCTYNSIIVNEGEVHKSKRFKGVAYLDGEWVGRIVSGSKTFEVKGVTERQVAVELDNIIDKERLPLEKQVQWV